MARVTGRPPKLTPERAEKILAAARAGVSRDAQAAAGGVDRSTLMRWLANGRTQKRGPYRDFRDALSRAENEAELRLVLRLQQIIGRARTSAPRLRRCGGCSSGSSRCDSAGRKRTP